jgi:hypothetical protein
MYKALAKDPSERFQTAHEFGETFKSVFIDDELTITLPPPPPHAVIPATTVSNSVLKTLTLKALPRTSRGFIAFAAVIVVILLFIPPLSGQIIEDLFGNRELPSPTSESSSSVPSMTGESYFSTRFNAGDDHAALFPQGDIGQFSREFTADGFYRLSNMREQSAVTAIADTSTVFGSVTITMEAVLQEDSHPASAYGIVFRYQDDNNYNVFATDGMGRYSIWVLDNGTWRELRGASDNWTPDEVVERIGATNRLTVDIIGDRFTGYVNNRRVTRVSDETFADGRVGIYVASDEGTATVLVDSFQVFPSVPSMTGQ